MSKARNGEGSIFATRDAKTGRVKYWNVEISLGKKPSGDRDRTRRRTKTESGAVALRSRLIAEKQRGRLTTIDADTVATYGIGWVRDVKAHQVRATTAADYEARLRREIIPMLGSVRMVDLKPAQIVTWMARLRDSGKSAATVNGARQVLRGMCKHAFRSGVLASNPVDATDPVKKQRDDPTQVREPWSQLEAHGVLNAARDHDLDGYLHVMLHTGLRPGEAMGLRWEDVDLEQRTLTVNGTLKAGRALMPDGQGVVTQVRNDPKTLRSQRTIPVAQALVEALERQQMRQSVQRMAANEWTETGYVFTTSVGTPYWPSNLRKKYQRFLVGIGVRYIRLHDIRHTVVRLALGEGEVPIEQVSQAVGHTRIDTTKQIYAGYVPRYNDKFVEGVSSTLPAASGPQPPRPDDASTDVHAP